MKITVVIPAHNEEQYIGRCLESIDNQRLPEGMDVDVIVVLNRCTDKTADIAKGYGATTLIDDSKNLSAIKNTGIRAASTEWVLTIDADSWMSEGVMNEIFKHAQSTHCLGGGIRIKPERRSVGITVGYAMMLVPAFFLKLSFGLYWFKKVDFEAIQGFDENRHIAEDVDFLQRLKRHGRTTGRGHTHITEAFITTSCRKFDEFGDWHFVRLFGNPCRVRKAIYGGDQAYLDKNWYEVKR